MNLESPSQTQTIATQNYSLHFNVPIASKPNKNWRMCAAFAAHYSVNTNH